LALFETTLFFASKLPASKMTAKLFHVVSFDKEESVAAVPAIWMIGEKRCWWPPYSGLQRLHKAVQVEEIPGSDWSSHACRILYSGKC